MEIAPAPCIAMHLARTVDMIIELVCPAVQPHSSIIDPCTPSMHLCCCVCVRLSIIGFILSSLFSFLWGIIFSW